MAEIIYVEDNADDVDIFIRLIKKLNIPITYTILNSGSEVIDYLSKPQQYSALKTPLPKLLLLDLNLAGTSGLDVLHWVRSADRTRWLPVVAFSTSDSPTDIRKAYEGGINAYLVKPGSYQATGTLLQQLCQFWVSNTSWIDYQ